ncbi:MAG: ATP-dependent Clp protease ATP-binding subunit ClpA [Planctomycetota bacterium]|jgi:ATP-dependent Clp protease ATP-binding subunit ClpA
MRPLHIPRAEIHVSQPQSSSVHRYFPLADSFVEVRCFDSEAMVVDAPQGMDREGYSRLVIQSCMPLFAIDLAQQLESLFPEAPQAAEDLLYEICIEVNPSLNINKVNLKPSTPEPRMKARKTSKRVDLLQQLAAISNNLGRQLSQRVHGQAKAIETVCRSVRKAAAGLSAPNQPLGSFLLVGRTGTGKTELCRQFARAMSTGDSKARGNLIRIDCSEYALAHEYSKLIGSPPGYVGHEEGGQLTRALVESPGAVLLFDEVEKAHPRMHNLLLQILEEGSLTDGRGNRIDLSKTFVLMTSNAGTDDIRDATSTVGFHRAPVLGGETLSQITDDALGRFFSPEFLGRLDEILLFTELDTNAARRIAQDQLMDLAIRAKSRGTCVAFTPAVARWVVDKGFSPEFGARELRNVISRTVEPALAEVLLDPDHDLDSLIRARIQAGELTFDRED